MRRKVKEHEWPIYQFTDKAAYAFLGPKDMYMISGTGSNSGNEGVCIDHYITRRMVLKHLSGASYDVDWTEFREKYDRLFQAYRTKIIGF